VVGGLHCPSLQRETAESERKPEQGVATIANKHVKATFGMEALPIGMPWMNRWLMMIMIRSELQDGYRLWRKLLKAMEGRTDFAPVCIYFAITVIRRRTIGGAFFFSSSSEKVVAGQGWVGDMTAP
jgi:hypothetical protein